ncbi:MULTISPECIES: hypothetical protein [Novosphingobium]|uniref:Uncharacterized protein n=1 Tax=Novosphingobium mangrovi (ex Huang et al. 2023) TaxID=2976432 RepID=A0ABT2I7V7_9SPHN|nr:MULTISPECIES: hypothetical protein [Novosphingobium]MCT2400881.1 hypothetical protein [Novosphingobium mangrovi (ex Huang et al. 2023)]
MRGILSAAPGPSAVRLIVGTHLPLIQAALVLWSLPRVDVALRVLVALVFTMALGGLVAAIHGGSNDDRRSCWRHGHGR